MLSRFLFVGGLVVFLSSSYASADVTLGGSRLAGMANAGIALPVDFGNVGQLNPAMYAHLPRRFGLITPAASLGMSNVSFSQIGDLTKFHSGSGIDVSVVQKLAQDYSGSKAELTSLASLGLDVYGVALIASGEAGLFSYPSATLQGWSKAGASGIPPVGSSLDAYGYAYSSYSAGYGVTEKLKPGNLDVGAQFNVLHFYYSHMIAKVQSGQNAFVVGPASDMPVGKDFADNQSASMDLGVHFAPTKSDFHYAAVLQNALEPNISYSAKLPNGAGNTDINPFRRQFNVGSAWTQRGTSVVLDVEDLGNHNSNSSIRGGVDTHLGWLGVRAGYDSRNGPTVGVTLLGVNVALSTRSDLSAAYAFRF